MGHSDLRGRTTSVLDCPERAASAVLALVGVLLLDKRRIRYEEAEMIERLGEEYVTYTREVRALVPLLW